MGHHARTLTALAAAMVATLLGAAPAGAHAVVVRAESTTATSIGSAFVDRVAVDTAGPVTIADANDPTVTATCAADSPVAALTAAIGAPQVRTIKDPTSGAWLISLVRGLAEPAGTPASPPAWFWRVYVDQGPVDHGANTYNTQEACTSSVPAGSEVLLYQACGAKTTGCFPGTPLYGRVREGGPYDVAPQTVPGRDAPVVIRTRGDGGPTGATVTTDEGARSVSLDSGPLFGQTSVGFTTYGPHTIMVSKGDGSRPPVRLPVCVSEGNDGYCGSTKVQAPPEIPYVIPSPCDTNGHDGFCGTPDTSGPVTHVTNIANNKVFKARKGPGQVKGTIEVDPNSVQDVRLRLTRTVTVKTKVKVKTRKRHAKPRYRTRTVKRCSAWDDGTLLMKTTKKCGPSAGAFFPADLTDLRDGFSYAFALTLPRGSYVLEVVARDENGFKDAPAAGRNVLKFTVK
ncbi:MAG TPA: hypothetical protein VFG42_13260 [Baekduia sp.]|uniref:hypothetical protein n=1 Tax=Baekduia sp. TaxID=2600305 RepID=UPI002D76A08C|nr:hypothetical protein [Baekduia sp.]HET6507753.1 hypothetical protein [Baekduia sp.]